MDAAVKSSVIRHLLADCPTCQKTLSTMGWNGTRLERLLHLPSTEPEAWTSAVTDTSGYNYDQTFSIPSAP